MLETISTRYAVKVLLSAFLGIHCTDTIEAKKHTWKNAFRKLQPYFHYEKAMIIPVPVSVSSKI